MCRNWTERGIHIFESLDEVREQFCIYSWALVKILFYWVWLSCNYEFHFNLTGDTKS